MAGKLSQSLNYGTTGVPLLDPHPLRPQLGLTYVPTFIIICLSLSLNLKKSKRNFTHFLFPLTMCKLLSKETTLPIIYDSLCGAHAIFLQEKGLSPKHDLGPFPCCSRRRRRLWRPSHKGVLDVAQNQGPNCQRNILFFWLRPCILCNKIWQLHAIRSLKITMARSPHFDRHNCLGNGSNSGRQTCSVSVQDITDFGQL